MTFIPASGVAVSKLEFSLSSNTVNDRVETSFSWNIGALPANARVIAVEYEITGGAWSHTSTGTYIRLGLYEAGVDFNNQALINGGNLEQPVGKYGAFDSNNQGTPQENYQTRDAQDLDLMVYTNAPGLNFVNDGTGVTVRVFYSIIT